VSESASEAPALTVAAITNAGRTACAWLLVTATTATTTTAAAARAAAAAVPGLPGLRAVDARQQDGAVVPRAVVREVLSDLLLTERELVLGRAPQQPRDKLEAGGGGSMRGHNEGRCVCEGV
jgi:hypothetical protein